MILVAITNTLEGSALSNLFRLSNGIVRIGNRDNRHPHGMQPYLRQAC